MTCIVVFFNDTATTEIYTLSLHDALPISGAVVAGGNPEGDGGVRLEVRCDSNSNSNSKGNGNGNGKSGRRVRRPRGDRKSTRLNSSHANISYAVFCLKKKQNQRSQDTKER